MSTAVTVNGVGAAVSVTWDPLKHVEVGRDETQPTPEETKAKSKSTAK